MVFIFYGEKAEMLDMLFGPVLAEELFTKFIFSSSLGFLASALV